LVEELVNEAVNEVVEELADEAVEESADEEAEASNESHDCILQLFKEAKIQLLAEEIDKLPKWQHVVELYGDGVVIVGKDNCAQYRDKVDFSDRIVAVAGLLNTGTNLLDIQLMRKLCGVKQLWQVPWGKH